MNESAIETELQYQVVVNQQGQYSIYLIHKELPVGWETCRFQGSKKQCLAHINSVWIDMRPASVKAKMLVQSKTESDSIV